MVARIHHATLAKAEKLGFKFNETTVEDSFYTLTAGKLKVVGGNAPQMVADMSVLKMLKAEYKSLKAEQSEEGGWLISLRDDVVGSGKTLQAAWDEASEVMAEGEAEWDETEGESGADDAADDEDASKSIIKRKYKTRYRPFKMTCGDDLSQEITRRFMVKGEDGKLELDFDAYVQFAKDNGVWDPEYKKLNHGQVRMNTRNRLAGKIRREDHKVIWIAAPVK